MLSVSIASGVYSAQPGKNSLLYTVSGINPDEEKGVDLVVALYAQSGALVGWQVVNRSAASAGDYQGAFDLGDSLFVGVETKGVSVRAWQGTAGSGYGPGVTSGASPSLGGSRTPTLGFKVNSAVEPGRRDSFAFTRRPTAGGSTQFLSGVTLDTFAAAPLLRLSRDTGLSSRDGITNDRTILVSGLEPGAAFQYRIGSDPSAWSAESSGNSFPLPNDGSYGQGVIQARQVDQAGNTSVPASLMGTVVLDTVAPTGTLRLEGFTDSGSSASDGLTNDNEFRVALDPSGLESGLRVTYQQWRGSDGFTDLRRTQVSRLADGSYGFRARLVDVAGNEGFTNTVDITVDRTPPQAPLLSRDGEAVTVEVSNLEAAAQWQYTANAGINWSALEAVEPDLTDSFLLATGSYPSRSIRARQQDAAGNVGAPGFLPSNGPVQVNTLVVGPDEGNFATIQAAVDAAPDTGGATVVVNKGPSYDEVAIDVDKPAIRIQQLYSVGSLNISLDPSSQATELQGGLLADRLVGGDANDGLNGGEGPDQLDGRGGVNTYRQFRGDSVAPTAVDASAGNTGATTTRWFVNGSSFTFGDGVDVITGRTFTPATFPTPDENGFIDLGNTLVFSGFDGANGVNAQINKIYAAFNPTAQDPAAAYAGQLIDSSGTIQIASSPAPTSGTFYLQGTWNSGANTFTVAAGDNDSGSPVNNAGVDLLLFSYGTAAQSAFDGASTDVNAWFEANNSMVIVDNTLQFS